LALNLLFNWQGMRKSSEVVNRKAFETSQLFQRATITALLVVLFGLLSSPVLAQSPPVVWSKPITGFFYWRAEGLGIALDQQDDFYFAASFATPFIPIGTQTLTNRSVYLESQAQNAFITKFSKTGDFLWVRQIGGTGVDEAGPCATDASGNVFVTGFIGSTNVLLGSTLLTNSMPHWSSCFLANYDPQGNVLWARQSVESSPQPWASAQGMSVAVDAGGNILLAGTFNSSNVMFGTNVLFDPGYSAPIPVSQDFLVKYSSAGDVLWAQTITVNDDSGASYPAVGVDTNGNAFLCSEFLGIAAIGTNTVTNVSGNFPGLLLAKFDPYGNLFWAEQVAHPGNGGEMLPDAVAVDLHGNCVIAGVYSQGTAMFPSNSFPVPPVQDNAFIAKFDASGDFLWANAVVNQTFGNTAVDAVGNCYFAGSVGAPGIISKYAGDGTLLWTTNSTNFPGGAVVAADPAGTLFLAGQDSAGGYSAVQLSGPTLNIQPSGNQVVVSWPTNEAGLGLESAPGLSGPWSPVTNPSPATIGNQYVVTNAVPIGSQYFRLGNL
jgi:hypothetical protein